MAARTSDWPLAEAATALGTSPSADDLAATELLAVALLAFDGTAYDRLRAIGIGDVLGVLAAMQPSSDAAHTTAAANTAVVKTYAAVAAQRHRLTLLGISWSGTAPAASVLLTVEDGAGGTVLFRTEVPITLNNPFFVALPPGGIRGSENTALVVTLAAGGAGAVGKLNTAKLTG